MRIEHFTDELFVFEILELAIALRNTNVEI